MNFKNVFQPYNHDHPPIRNVNDIFDEKLSMGQRVSDKVASVIGSWEFIITQSVLLFIWVVLNVIACIKHWDPYPFILLNLFLSLQAAYTAPILMMSQNRLADKDRLQAHNDYQINIKTEKEVRILMEQLHAQNEILITFIENQNKSQTDLENANS